MSAESSDSKSVDSTDETGIFDGLLQMLAAPEPTESSIPAEMMLSLEGEVFNGSDSAEEAPAESEPAEKKTIFPDVLESARLSKMIPSAVRAPGAVGTPKFSGQGAPGSEGVPDDAESVADGAVVREQKQSNSVTAAEDFNPASAKPPQAIASEKKGARPAAKKGEKTEGVPTNHPSKPDGAKKKTSVPVIPAVPASASDSKSAAVSVDPSARPTPPSQFSKSDSDAPPDAGGHEEHSQSEQGLARAAERLAEGPSAAEALQALQRAVARQKERSTRLRRSSSSVAELGPEGGTGKSNSPVSLRGAAGASTPVATASGAERVKDVQHLVETLDRRILSMVQQGDRSMRLTVQSGDLGRLTVLCREEGSALQIEIQASNSAVQNLLQRQEGAVRDLLQSHGTSVSQFDVTSDGGPGGRAQQHAQSGAGEKSGGAPWGEAGIEPALEAEEPVMASVPSDGRSGQISILA